MADIKKNRTQAKGKLTRSVKDLQEILNKTENVTLDKIHHYISEFQDKLKVYDKQNEFELSFENEDDMLAEIEPGEEFRKQKIDIFIKFKELETSLLKNKDSESSSSRSSVGGEGKNIVNLPKLTLPTFDGDILTFQSFWDKFTAIIDSREDLPKVNKFSYLQSVLKGDAKASLQGMSLTASNYDTAKELLQRKGLDAGRKCIVAPAIQPLVEYTRFSSWNKLVRVVMLVMNFIDKLKSKWSKWGNYQSCA